MGSTSVPLRSSPEARLAAAPNWAKGRDHVERLRAEANPKLSRQLAPRSGERLDPTLGDGSVEAVLTNTYADAGSAHGKTT
jgi:hypothetical protein